MKAANLGKLGFVTEGPKGPHLPRGGLGDENDAGITRIMRTVYAIFSAAGLLLPSYCFARHFTNPSAGGWSAFWAAPWSSWVQAGFSWDLVLTAMVALTWIVTGYRGSHPGRRWLYVVAAFGVGICFALPLYLWREESRRLREQEKKSEE